MLDIVKKSLKISTDVFDSDLKRLIESCKIDLSISGVKKIDLEDQLIQQAIILYCKANFGNRDIETERINVAYESLKISLSLCGDYG